MAFAKVLGSARKMIPRSKKKKKKKPENTVSFPIGSSLFEVWGGCGSCLCYLWVSGSSELLGSALLLGAIKPRVPSVFLHIHQGWRRKFYEILVSI